MDVEKDTVDELYAIFNKIRENQKSGKSSENPPLFEKILAAAAPDSEVNSKRLSAQFICRLFRDLPPQQQKTAYNALIDLVEEDDVQTRKQVISGLPRLCRDAAAAAGTVGHASKVADVLVQLLQTDDDQELSMVQHSLLQVLNCNALEAVDGIFGQINHADVPDVARLRAIRLLGERLLCVDRAQMTPKVEEAIVEQVDRALEDVSEEEFVHLVRVLASLQCMQTLGGRQRLVDMICAQADFAADFQPLDAACVAKVRGCARQALPFLSKNIIAAKFVVYFLDRVLPTIALVPGSAVVDGTTDRPRLDLLKQFAELSGHAGPNFQATDAQLSSLLSCISSVMPLPSTESEVAAAAAEDLNFSEAECLLLALHQLGRSQFLVDRPAELAELRRRMQHFQLANASYQKSLKAVLEAQPPELRRADRARLAALATTDTVAQLIRELFRSPPALLRPDAAPAPSWRRVDGHRRAAGFGGGRPPLPTSPASSLGAAPRKRRAVDLPAYRPPAGKFSAGVGRAPAAASAATASSGGAATAAGGRSRYRNVYTFGAAPASTGQRPRGGGRR